MLAGPRQRRSPALVLLPGLALTGVLAALAFALRHVPGIGLFGPMILAIAAGAAWKNLVGVPATASAGIGFAMRRLLRLAIVLLGLQLTLHQVIGIGLGGLAVLVATVLASFAFTLWLGGVLGVQRGLTQLIAAGTSICGASAVMAANTVARSDEADVAYAIACITLFGSMAMFGLPLLAPALGLDAGGYGLWVGASVHEVGQAVAAGFQQGPAAGELATVVKLGRVLLLAPVVLLLAWACRRRPSSPAGGDAARAPVPWFVFGFLALVACNSLIGLPEPARQAVGTLTMVLLAMAMAALGLVMDVGQLRARGWRPLLLGLLAWLFIAGFSLLGVGLVG